MATIIFDFDDTLFETHKLKDSIFGKMESLGIPTALIKDTYKKAVDKFKHYTIDNHINVINEISGHSIHNDMIKNINNIDFDQNYYNETFFILKSLYQKNTLILLTRGDKRFQEFKIKNSGFYSYFHQIHIISREKEDFLDNQKFKGDVYFINDKISENEIIRDKFPYFKVIDFDIKKGGPKELSLIFTNLQ